MISIDSIDVMKGINEVIVRLPLKDSSGNGVCTPIKISWTDRKYYGYLAAIITLPNGEQIDSFYEGEYKGFVDFSLGGTEYQVQVSEEDRYDNVSILYK